MAFPLHGGEIQPSWELMGFVAASRIHSYESYDHRCTTDPADHGGTARDWYRNRRDRDRLNTGFQKAAHSSSRGGFALLG